MSGPSQRTISKDVTLEGVGVHSGASARVTLRPATAGSGVRFRRVDLEGSPEIAADLNHVVRTELGTTLGVGDATVGTVEHVLAALAGLSIDNVVIDVDGPEMPICDGSFADYVAVLDDGDPVEQDAPAELLVLTGPVSVDDDSGASYVAAPGPGLRVSATIDFAHSAIGRRYGSFGCDDAAFRAELMSARTFGFKADVDALHERGLALGASLENSVVLDDSGVLNDGGLRFDDEYLRHKVGDVIGDLALLGGRLSAHIVAERPSHAGNVALARAIRAKLRRSGPPIADITKIMEFLPHRYPMLLVDRIIDLVDGERVVALKNVTINEPFFQGHFPGHPVMPGVLIIEAMAQCGGILLMDRVENPEEKVVYFMTMDNVKFRRPVTPGDTIIFELEVLQFRRGTCRMKGRGLVDGHVVAEAEFMAGVMDK